MFAPAISETIIVVGLRVLQPLTSDAAVVTVIEREEIAQTPQRLIDGVLRGVPSVATFRRSSSATADPTSQGLNLRGLGPSGVSRSLVLLDGVPLGDAFGGWVYWRALSLLTIDNIAVQPSGASAQFGNFALGGVVAVASRPIGAQEIDVVAMGGAPKTAQLAARVADRFGRRGQLGVVLDTETWFSGGFAPIAAEQRGAVDGEASSWHGSGGGAAEWVFDRMVVRGSLRHFYEHLDTGTEFTTASVATTSASADATLSRAHGRLHVAAFGGVQSFRQTRARVAEDRDSASLASEQDTPSQSQGLSATWTSKSGGTWTWMAGIDAHRVKGTATDTLTPAMMTATSLRERAAGGQQHSLGAYAQASRWLWPRVALAGALRADGWQHVNGQLQQALGDGTDTTTFFADRSDLELSPRVGVVIKASDQLTWRHSIYRAFRAPTLNELYRPFQVGSVLTAANPALRPEIVWGGELGPQVTVNALSARATAFWNKLWSPIGNITLAEPNADGATRQRQNLGVARTMGMEIELQWRPSATWSATLGYTFVDSEVLEAPAQPALIGKQLAQDPRHRAVASLVYAAPHVITLSADLRYSSDQFEDDANALPLGDALTLDLVATRNLGAAWELFAIAQNVFDERYLVGRAGVDTVGAPRTLLLGLRYASAGRNQER